VINVQKAELQDEPADGIVNAGICGLKTIYKCGGLSFPISLTVTVPTRRRGVHMSRLVGAVLRNTEGRNIEDALRAICREVNRTQAGCTVLCRFDYPIADQFMRVSVELNEVGPINYSFKKHGITSCPCSKDLCGIGHMQRAQLVVRISSEGVLDFIDVGMRMDTCFSATLSEHLKRDEEVSKILAAQEKPRFVEDLVRACREAFPGAGYIEARSLESIHSHDAIAFWKRA
jgi:GTP cyclohydrolase FolE2